jgi:signal recognition particle receptor subunit alpha
MIDCLSISTQGGILIYSRQFSPSLSINDSIDKILLNPTVTQTTANKQVITWKQTDKLLIICQSLVKFEWIQSLLDLLACQLETLPADGLGCIDKSQFDEVFDLILKDTVVVPQKQTGPRPFNQTEKYLKTLQACQVSKDETNAVKEMTVEERLAKLKQRGKGKGKKLDALPKSAKGPAQKGVNKVLDYSEQNDGESEHAVDQSLVGDALGNTSKGFYDALELQPSVQKPSSSIFSMFTNMLKGTPLTEAKLAPIMTKMKEHLVAKNVAQATSAELCKLVSVALKDSKLGPMESIDALVRKEMQNTLMKVLMPDSSVNILNEILAKQSSATPYSMVFVGVNGVGKSTNLSKVCFWLLQNKLSVLIAACDTFRSGAVEQLKVHVRNLKSLLDAKIELYDAGIVIVT